METILLALTIGTLCIVCFYIGTKTGQKVVIGEEIKSPDMSKLNPKKIYNKHQEKKEIEKERNKIETILRNVERYDGTDAGQEDVPM